MDSVLPRLALQTLDSNAAVQHAISAVDSAGQKLQSADSRDVCAQTQDVAQALSCVLDLIPQFLPPGSRETITKLPDNLSGHSSSILEAASSISSSVSDQPRLLLCTSLARFVRGACVMQPECQRQALQHCGTHALLLATASPLLLQAGGERWDEFVNVFVRVVLQMVCNALAGKPSGTSDPPLCTRAAETALWNTAFPAVFTTAFGTAGIRSDAKMAANTAATLYSFLRRESQRGGASGAAGGLQPTKLAAAASATDLLQGMVRAVAPKHGASAGGGGEHITEHPAFDWISLTLELFLEHELIAGAHQALSGSDSASPSALTLDHVVFAALLDAVLYSSGLGSDALGGGDQRYLSGHLRSIMTPLEAGAMPPLPVTSLSELLPPPVETDAQSAVAASVAVQHTQTCVRLLGQRAHNDASGVDDVSPAPPCLPFMAAELACMGPWAAVGDRGVTQGPSGAGAPPSSPADTPPAGCTREWVPHSYVSDMLQALANLTFRHSDAVQCVLDTPGALESALSHCKMSDSQPMQREWALMLVRNLCEVAPQAQQRIADLKARGVTRSAELEKAGVQPVFDPATGKVKLTTADGKEYRPPAGEGGAAAGAGGGASKLGGRAMELAGAEGAAAMMGVSIEELGEPDAGEGVFSSEDAPSTGATAAATRVFEAADDGDFM